MTVESYRDNFSDQIFVTSIMNVHTCGTYKTQKQQQQQRTKTKVTFFLG